MITEEKNIIDKFLASFQRRTVAITTNTIVATPDIPIKKTGVTEFPSRSSADDKTDNMYVTMPKIASILFFILFYYTSRSLGPRSNDQSKTLLLRYAQHQGLLLFIYMGRRH